MEPVRGVAPRPRSYQDREPLPVPDRLAKLVRWPGVAPRPTEWKSVMLTIDTTIASPRRKDKMEARTGLAPAKAWVAITRLDYFSIRAKRNWGERRDLHPHLPESRSGALLVMLRPPEMEPCAGSAPTWPAYETGASLTMLAWQKRERSSATLALLRSDRFRMVQDESNGRY